jgi:hypothetical protein
VNPSDPVESAPDLKSKDIVVFMVRRDSECAECKQELWKGRFIRLMDGKALCLECADLDHLEYLPRGDAAVTRRAGKYSPLRAVVVRWSRTRNRYERQGTLVAREAIERAEQECLADAEARGRRQEREAERRAIEDEEYRAKFALAIREQYPGCPAEEASAIADHACRKHSGRVGRSAAAKELGADAIALAVRAHVRHVHTGYDEILMQTDDRSHARSVVHDEVALILSAWQRFAP